MKKLILILSLAFALPLTQTGCQTVPPPEKRVVAVKTLISVGQTAEAALDLCVQLTASGRISGAHAREVVDFYNRFYKPAFDAAKIAVLSDMSAAAPFELVKLAGELASMVAKFSTPSP